MAGALGLGHLASPPPPTALSALSVLPSSPSVVIHRTFCHLPPHNGHLCYHRKLQYFPLSGKKKLFSIKAKYTPLIKYPQTLLSLLAVKLSFPFGHFWLHKTQRRSQLSESSQNISGKKEITVDYLITSDRQNIFVEFCLRKRYSKSRNIIPREKSN